MSEVASAYVTLIPSYRGGTRQIEAQLTPGATKAGSNSGQRFGSSFLSTAKTVLTATAVYEAVTKGFAFAKDAIFGFNSTLEQSSIAFTTMLGSAEKASGFIGDLQSFAKATPFAFEDLVKNSQLLLGMGISANKVIPYLTALGDSVASVGGDTDVLNNTILAFAQMASKGTVSMDNMNQLLEGGMPTALTVLAAKFGVTTGEMVDMISKGQVAAADALPALVSGIEQGTSATAALGGMMDKQSHTFSGAISNIKDGADQLLAAAFKPLFDTASSGMQSISAWMSGPTFTQWSAKGAAAVSRVRDGLGGLFTLLTKGDYTSALAKAFGIDEDSPIVSGLLSIRDYVIKVWTGTFIPTIKTVLNVGQSLLNFFVALGSALAPVAAFVAGGLLAGWRALLAVFNGLTPVLAVISSFIREHQALIGTLVVTVGTAAAAWALWTVGVKTWKSVSESAKAAQESLNKVMNANPYVRLAILLAALVTGVVYAWQHFETFRNIVKGVWSVIQSAFTTGWHILQGIFNAMMSAFRSVGSVFGSVVGGLKSAFNGLVSAFKSIGSALRSAWYGVWNTIKATWRAIWSPIQGAIASSFATIQSIALTVWSGVEGTWNAVWNGVKGVINWALRLLYGFVNGFVKAATSGAHYVSNAWSWIPGLGSTNIPIVEKAIGDPPQLATGGLTTGPTLALIGDNPGGQELVLPLNRAASFLADVIGDTGSGATVGTMNIYNQEDPLSTARAVTRRIAALGGV